MEVEVKPGEDLAFERRRQDALIALICVSLDGMEKMRIQVGNRAAQVTRTEPDKDGIMRGMGMTEDSPLVRQLLETSRGLRQLETELEHELERHMKMHPLGPWIQARRGMGYKGAGRLIGAIGDPYMRSVLNPEDGTWSQVPRSLWQLNAYCGMHVTADGTAPVRRRGVKSNWNETARKRLYIISVSQRYGRANHYRPVYDAARRAQQGAVHATACVRCGPSGAPAAAGSPLSAAHADARALRKVSQAVLADLWKEARSLHGVSGNEDGLDPGAILDADGTSDPGTSAER